MKSSLKSRSMSVELSLAITARKENLLSSNVEIPKHLYNEKDKFKSSTVSLNNKLVFMATCLHEIPHRGNRRI